MGLSFIGTLVWWHWWPSKWAGWAVVIVGLAIAETALRSDRRASDLKDEIDSLRHFVQLAEERIFALQDDVARLNATSRTEQPSARQPPRGFQR